MPSIEFGFPWGIKFKNGFTCEDRDHETLARVVRRMANHSVLYEDHNVEYNGSVVDSIQRMRS